MDPEIVDEEVVEVEDESVETETADAEETSEEIDWEARAKKAEALIVKNKKEPKPEEVIKTNDSDSLKRDVEELKLSRMGYSDEVIKDLMDLGGLSALKNPLVKKSADDLQADFNARKAASIEDGPQGQTKTKYSKEDLANMSSEEMEKVLPHADY